MTAPQSIASATRLSIPANAISLQYRLNPSVGQWLTFVGIGWTQWLSISGRVIYCQSNEECSMRFSDSMCSFGRCQCISGHKVNGKCLKSMIGSGEWTKGRLSHQRLGFSAETSRVVANPVNQIIPWFRKLKRVQNRFNYWTRLRQFDIDYQWMRLAFNRIFYIEHAFFKKSSFSGHSIDIC